MYFCPECNGFRWRNLRRGKIFKCRECGYTKGEKKEEVISERVPIVRGIPIRIKEPRLSFWQRLWQKIRN